MSVTHNAATCKNNNNPSCYLPKNWRCPDSVQKSGRFDDAAWLVSLLYKRHQFHEIPSHRRGYPISSLIAKKHMGWKYNETIGALVERGDLILAREYYNPQFKGDLGRCREYLLPDELASCGYRKLVYRNAKFMKRLNQHISESSLSMRYQLDPYPNLRGWIYRIGVSKNAPVGDVLSLGMLANRDPFIHICEMGRLHTPITNLKREYRRYLTYQGAKLWQADIRASQPLLNAIAAKLGRTPDAIVEYARSLDPNGKVNKTGHIRDHQGCEFTTLIQDRSEPSADWESDWVDVSDYDCFEDPTPKEWEPILDSSTIPDLDSPGDDVQKLIDICTDHNADLYSMFACFDDSNPIPRALGRDEVKPGFLKSLYCRPDFADRYPVTLRFKQYFPTVWEFLQKRNQTSSIHGEAARYAQTLESYVVIHVAAKRFLAERPDSPLWTVHDSLVTTEANIEFAQKCILDAFRDTFAVEPIVKTSEFGEG